MNSKMGTEHFPRPTYRLNRRWQLISAVYSNLNISVGLKAHVDNQFLQFFFITFSKSTFI